jgi:mannose-6-phosphate isomerase-like protein (cupin superfamily)
MTKLMRSVALGTLLAAAIPTQGAVAHECQGQSGGTRPNEAAADRAHIVLGADELAWKKGPASLPPGAEIALIEGDPSKAAPFTFRLRFPAGYEIPPHTHPAIEHVTVLSGRFVIGMGESFDPAAGRELTTGGFVALPPGHPHSAWTRDETVVQLHSVGPWGITYLDPADDPRGD